MTLKTKLGKINAEDYNLMLAKYAPVRGVQQNPAAYSRQETEQAYLAYWRFMAELVERYEIDDMEGWVVSEYSGTIFVDTARD
ncbi:hypothetical protein LCGC14_1632170 [marine sediment metagenome]|uniref:Uncharacterized protein n=1 Tax=marine sediment metagenome TaxID=412755 RepID=A0A0F9I2J9_9ZZZZ